MLIRNVNSKDCDLIFKWRNDKVTREMFINSDKITYQKHLQWFTETLDNPLKYLYIGEIKEKKIGICRFDINKEKVSSDVSININPDIRGKGIGKKLLTAAIENFEIVSQLELTAQLKINNHASKKIFEYANFEVYKIDKDLIKLVRYTKTINFKVVTVKDIKILYDLLKKRKYTISHNTLPSFETHKKFVLSEPYQHWYIITENQNAIGTFYIQKNNSIGLNIISPSIGKVKKILDYINKHIEPNKSYPSKTPCYFYINVAPSNYILSNILEEIGCLEIQKSYKL